MKIKLSKNFSGDHINLGNGVVLFQGRDDIVDVKDTLELQKALQAGSVENVELCKDDEQSTEDKTCVTVKEGDEIWVFAEQRNGKLQQVVHELLGIGTELKNQMNVKLAAVLVCEDRSKIVQELFNYGADKVYVIEHPQLMKYQTLPYTKVLSSLIRNTEPSVFLMGATHIGKDLAPRIAKRVSTGLTADCTHLEVEKDGLLAMTKPAYGGNLMATIKCPKTKPQMATIRPGVMQPIEPNEENKGAIVKVNIDINESDIGAKLVEFIQGKKKALNLDKADIIISGGRGVGCQENFNQLKKFADVLGAEIGTTRAAVDEGWVEHDRMIGQTGKTVKPKLYIACGISGAIQHRAGIEKSGMIIAVNKDPNAEIFSIADYGVVADLNQLIPELISILETPKVSSN